MRGCVVAILCFASGCLPTIDVSPPPRCEADGGISTPSGRAVLIDEPTTVFLSRKAAQCPPPTEVALSATVTDPTGSALPATLEGPFARGQFVTAEVRFTPVAEGLHRVQVDFAEGLGRATNDVFAVQRARLGQRLATIDGAVTCLREGATTQGAWVCLEPSTRVSFWRGEAQLQVVPADDVQLVGDVVWVIRAGELERFVDTGGSVLTRAPDAVLRPNVAEPDQLVAVDADTVFVLVEQTVLPFTVTAGQLIAGPQLELPRGLCPVIPHLSPRSATELTFTCGSRPGFLRQCALEVANPSGVRCDEVGGRLVGTSPRGMWTLLDGALAFTFADGAPSVSRALPAGFVVNGTHRLVGTFSPLVADGTGASFLVDARPLGVSIGLVPAGLTVLGSSDDRVLLSGSTTRFFTRLEPR